MVDELPLCEPECDFDEPVTFDEEAAKGLSPSEIREKWPRKFSKCKKCQHTSIRYASYAHYVYGDW